MRLTDEQLAAVNEPGHVCLTSCPGSGKTRVIVAKLLRCIDQVAGSTRRAACITHTNPAADEIECRLKEICFGTEELYYDVCTIHGFALQNILRPFHRLLPEFANGFEVLTSQSEEYAQKAAELLSEHGLRRQLIDEFERVQRSLDGSPIHLDTLPIEVQREWCDWLDENSYITLNEIVHHSGRLVTAHEHIASALASRFAWILVDEFQDSSSGQVAILKAIHRFRRTTFFCVGDPNQSIYRFAGASPELLLDFANYIGANVDHRLTGNFRSSAAICAVAELLCASDPPMRAVGEHADCAYVPEHKVFATASAGIFDYFLPMAAEMDIPLGRIAILSSWWVSLFNLAREMRERGIPVIGPGARPYKRSHQIAQLMEAVGGFLEYHDARLGTAVQRAVFCLAADLTNHTPQTIFNFAGRVAICKLLAVAASAREDSNYASEWIQQAGDLMADVLVEADILTEAAANSFRLSAKQMVEDILNRAGGDELTVEELGIFARPENCIQLLTVHKAKGREFDAVALIETHDGRFPHFSIDDVTDEDERQAIYDESRRVVYVGATRAKRLLTFLTDTSHWRNRPSPFLAEMGF